MRHCIYTLNRLLGHNYAVIAVSGEQIINDPWPSTCAAIVFPGGADLGYCRTLNGEGNRRIRRFVESGGVYIGFCAGGYYGSGRCEFEVGNNALEVVGDRELAFFPGIDRGGAFKGFVYNSERGARAAELKVKYYPSPDPVPAQFDCYYNGGGVFVDAEKYADRGVEILANYAEPLDVDSGQNAAAVILCKYGQGKALLTGPHPEFSFSRQAADNWSQSRARFITANSMPKEEAAGFDKLVRVLVHNESQRMLFMSACLVKLGLDVGTRKDKEKEVPPQSPIHLSCEQPFELQSLVAALKENIYVEDGEQYMDDDSDKFHFVDPSAWDMEGLRTALRLPKAEEADATNQTHGSTGNRIRDYSNVTKNLLVHISGHPSAQQTPQFNHGQFYHYLTQYQASTENTSFGFGQLLLYGEVVSSTNTLLEKNTQLLRHLPTGTTATASCQLDGRGRGTNVWVSNPGSLVFSTVIRHPMDRMQQAPVVFLQYLAALAVIDGIKSYDGDLYHSMPVKLKWPNDIYALDPRRESWPPAYGIGTSHHPAATARSREDYVKIGGILVNSHYNMQDYIAVCGIGLNLDNLYPTTCLNALLPLVQRANPHLPPLQRLTPERLLPRILTTFDALYGRFLRTGFDRSLQNHYYDHWLHHGQVVTLETAGGMRARITGITGDFGQLVAEEVEEEEPLYYQGPGGPGKRYGERDWEGSFRGTGRMMRLQSDSNSFDFFRGLITKKM